MGQFNEVPPFRSPPMDHAHLVSVMRRLALEAGARILDFYRSPDLAVRAKDDASPVTAADEAADRLIAEGLAAAFPGLRLVTEEQAGSHGGEGRSFLIVDPLDGTREFVERRGDFTVNIAWVADGVPVLGVVFAPATGRLFYTGADGRSVEEGAPRDAGRPGPLRPLRVATPDNAALRVVASKSHRDAATDAYIARYAVAPDGFRSAGSSLKFCLLAGGEADLYPRLGRTMEWDTAAGHAIANEAGRTLEDVGTGAPLRYNKHQLVNPWFIVH